MHHPPPLCKRLVACTYCFLCDWLQKNAVLRTPGVSRPLGFSCKKVFEGNGKGYLLWQ